MFSKYKIRMEGGLPSGWGGGAGLKNLPKVYQGKQKFETMWLRRKNWVIYRGSGWSKVDSGKVVWRSGGTNMIIKGAPFLLLGSKN